METNLGLIIYYIVEIVIFGCIAYMSFVKTEYIMNHFFKKDTNKQKMLTYAIGVIAVTQVIRSLNGIMG